MGLKKELTPQERREIINKRMEGLSYQKIAGKDLFITFLNLVIDYFWVSKTAVINTVKRFEETKSLDSRPRSGRHNKFSPHENRMIRIFSIKNPELSSVEIWKNFMK